MRAENTNFQHAEEKSADEMCTVFSRNSTVHRALADARYEVCLLVVSACSLGTSSCVYLPVFAISEHIRETCMLAVQRWALEHFFGSWRQQLHRQRGNQKKPSSVAFFCFSNSGFLLKYLEATAHGHNVSPTRERNHQRQTDVIERRSGAACGGLAAREKVIPAHADPKLVPQLTSVRRGPVRPAAGAGMLPTQGNGMRTSSCSTQGMTSVQGSSNFAMTDFSQQDLPGRQAREL